MKFIVGLVALLMVGCKPGLAAEFSELALRDSKRVYVVSGATGRSGSLAYKLLRNSPTVQVRALVRNITKAKEMLECGDCTEQDGIFVGDVTKPETLSNALEGASGLIILTSAIPIKKDGKFTYPKGGFPIDVDWHGAVNQIRAAVAKGLDHVILVSTIGTTDPESLFPGNISFYKLNGEAFLMQSRLAYTIIKPCGLTDKKFLFGSQVGQCDKWKIPALPPLISRNKVAHFVSFAAEHPAQSSWLRFDVCSNPMAPLKKDDFAILFQAASNLDTCSF